MSKISRFKFAFTLLALAIAFFMPVAAEAQITGTNSVTLTYNVAESISISPSVSSLVLTTSPQNIQFTAAWNLAGSRATLGATTYFTSTTALGGPGSGINSANILTTPTQQGGAETPCNLTASQASEGTSIFNGLTTPGATCSSIMWNTLGGGGFAYNGTGSWSYAIRLNPSAVASLAEGSYSGTLNVLIVAI